MNNWTEYNRDTIEYVKQPERGYLHKPTGQLFTGKGITRFLYGYKQKLNATAVQAGLSMHAELEHGEIASKPAKAIHTYCEANFDKLYKEIFFAGDFFGKPCVGYADSVAVTGDKLCLIEFKFSSKPENMNKGNTTWRCQLAMEAMLMHEMHGIMPKMYEIIIAHPKTAKLTVIKGDWTSYGTLLNIAMQKGKNHGLL